MNLTHWKYHENQFSHNNARVWQQREWGMPNYPFRNAMYWKTTLSKRKPSAHNKNKTLAMQSGMTELNYK